MPHTKPISGQTLAVSTTVLSIRNDSGVALIEVQAQAIRYRISGADPTASAGYIGAVGDIIELVHPQQVANFRVIRKDGTDATIEITYALGYIS